MKRSIFHKRLLAASVATVVGAFSLTGCAPATGSDEIVIRIAMGSSGEAVDTKFDDLKATYEDMYPGRSVEIVVQEDDIYQTTGLSTLLSSRDAAPDAYFEWSGPRMRQHAADGNAVDVSAALAGPLFEGRFDAGAFSGMDVDGSGTYMVPWTGDVTVVVWYNKQIYADLGLAVPTTWEEFMAVSEAIKAAGITPIVSGNKDQWPMGNWASQVASRVMGEEDYALTMNGELPMDSGGMITTLGYIGELADRGLINESVNALADDEANTQFFLGKAAMIPIGSWLMADAATDGEGLDFGYFNTPEIASGKGDQTSVLGISTGFIVNAKSRHIDETLEFLALVAGADGTKLWAQAGLAPMALEPFSGVEVDPRTESLAKLLSTTSMVVRPADSGYNIEVAAAFYDAVSVVIGGGNIAEAAATAEKRVAEIR
jgi:raffinose/stachyose/melibiose transport system substrate-binding protein